MSTVDSAFSGRVALVTGGSKGIGRVTSRALAARGAHVIVNYFHSADAARATVDEIVRLGGSAEALRASVAKPDDVTELFARIQSAHGGLDVLVNNAARGTLAPMDTLREEDWTRAMAVNLDGSRRCAQAAAPLMAARGKGAIVNVSSIGGGFVLGNYATVGVSKGALEALTRYLAVEFASLGIRVNTASAGPVDGATVRLFPDADAFQEVVVAATPLGRLATEADLAELVLFLADDRSGFITGQTILADGGLSLSHAALSPPTAARALAAPHPRRAPAAPSPGHRTSTSTSTSTSTEGEGFNEAVAVVGMGVKVPGADGTEEFWELLHHPKPAFTEPGDRYDLENFWSSAPHAPDKSYSRVAGFIHGPQHAPGAADRATPASAWLHDCLNQARTGVRLSDADRVGVYVGAWPGGSQGLAESLVVRGAVQAVTDEVGAAAAAEIQETLREHYRYAVTDMRLALPDAIVQDAVTNTVPDPVEAVVVDTACASALYAVDLGATALLDGACDIAFCGGVEVFTPVVGSLFSQLRGLSPSGRVKSMDADADGTLFSDGAGLVALKLLSRAQADGDRVLGVLAGFGAASDGRGKAIHAPNPEGQRRCLRRAYEVNGLSLQQTDWVLAHATGTRVGDRIELRMLNDLSPEKGVLCTANKTVVGHTGWAAGAVSMVHALLALEHEHIPAQPDFGQLPQGIDSAAIRVPDREAPFPAEETTPRTVGLSAFGFGGTNAHLLVQDLPPHAARPPRTAPAVRPDEIVLVGWSAHLPGEPDHEAVARWLRSEGQPPDRSFGRPYPLPDLTRVRLPATTLRAIDPTQVMAIEVAARFAEEHGKPWAAIAEQTGVFVAHTGALRALTEATLRCYLDDLAVTLGRRAEHAQAAAAIGRWSKTVRAATPEPTEDTQAGVMSNVIASRVAAHLDLRGTAMTIDAGPDSARAALTVARRQLQSGRLKLALVLTCCADPASELLGGHGTSAQPAEGAFLLAVTTREQADAQGWTVLAAVDTDRPHEAADTDEGLRGAEHFAGAKATLRLLADSVKARPAAPPDGHGLTIPHSRTLRITACPRPGDPSEAVPPGGFVLLGPGTHATTMTTALERAGAVVACGAAEAPADAVRIDDADESRTAPRLRALTQRCRPDLTVFTGFAEVSGARVPEPDPALLRLHDVMFLATRALWPRWDASGGMTVVGGGCRPADSDPHAALFTGFVRALAWERPAASVGALLTEAPVGDPRMLGWLAAERRAVERPPVAYYLDGTRYVEALTETEPPVVGDVLPLTADSTVVVAGGTSGIVNALLHDIGEQVTPRLWLLGRSPLDQESAEPVAAAGRAELLLDLRRRHPEAPVRELVARADQTLAAQARRAALRRLGKPYGADRVTYLPCDVRDPQAVRDAAAAIRRHTDRIDLVIHAAGLPGGALIEHRSLESFRAVRDTKVLGYHHLKEAFAQDDPALWCNIGSVLGSAFGLPGEADYCAGNEFLAWCATRSGSPGGEFTAAFPLWAQAGAFSAGQLNGSATLTAVPTAETARQFRRELQAAAARRGGTRPYLGKLELRRAVAEHTGHHRDALSKGPRRAYLNRSEAMCEEPATWKLSLDRDTDGYLWHHTVDGKPTLPGTFLLEIAAEAACHLLPGRVVRALLDSDFTAFVRPFTGSHPRHLLVRAEQLRGGPSRHGGDTVLVTIDSAPDTDRAAPSRRHLSTTILLNAPEEPRLPDPFRPAETVGPLVPDPYESPDSSVALSGVFRNVQEPRATPTNARAVWAPRLGDTPLLREFTLPAVLLDATLRTGALLADPAAPPIAPVPRAVGRVALFTTGNDADIAERYGNVITLHHGADGTSRACTPDGNVLLEISNTNMTVPS
ncbi:SDR family oxidoreductase [Actinomycetota bacterium Odt1-20B]